MIIHQGLTGNYPVFFGLRMFGSLFLAFALSATAANIESVSRSSVRAAIADLRATFGARYPDAQTFSRRLDILQATNESAQLRALAREALLANPLVCGQPLLFVVRRQYLPDHHNTATFFPVAAHEYNTGAFTPGSALKTLDLRTGQVRTLLDCPAGVVRDPEVHFSGARIVFSMRANLHDSYHVYELRSDGSALRQLTFAPDVDDIDPLYLPDDSLVFSSTREPKYCACNRHIMANLYRMDPDGANIHQIGKSTLFEGHPSLLPDGRLLYDRWEYVDRNFGDAQSLWSAYPDGTSHLLYWGNNTASPGAVIDSRAISGTEHVLCVFGSCHDRPWGALAVIDRSRGIDGLAPVVRTWPASATNLVRQSGWELFDAYKKVKLKYEDPFPLGDRHFLCARMTGQGEQTGIYLLDLFGNELLLHAEKPGCFDPMPLGPRSRPPVLPARRDFQSDNGYFYIADVYQGTHMRRVPRGAVKFLRVVESPEKRFWTVSAWNGQGQEAPAMNWHDFNNKRILGTVPVEADGSVAFAVPAERFVYFQLLDAQGLMVQSMRSGTTAQPGEHAGCTGCHEDRRMAPPAPAANLAWSSPREPRPLSDWYGPPRLFSYRAEVQPVFDRHCVRCHDFGKPEGKKLILAGDRDLVFNASYSELWHKQLIKVVGAGPSEIQPAYSWGAHPSKLLQVLRTNHAGVKLNSEEIGRIATWIDLNAPYYPTYATAHPDHLAGRSPLNDAELARLEQLTGVPLRAQADFRKNCGPQIAFDRPELSPCLASLKDSALYQEALTIVSAGAQRLADAPEPDAPGFVPCPMDKWREQKYLARRAQEARSRQALRGGQKTYDRPEMDR